MNQVFIELDPQWVLKFTSSDTLPADVIAGYIESGELGCVKEKGFTELMIHSDKVDQSNLSDFRTQLIVYMSMALGESVAEISQHLDISVGNSELPQASEAQKKPSAVVTEKQPHAPAKPDVPPTPVEEKAESVIAQIRKLQGTSRFTALCESILQMAPVLRERSLQSVCTSIRYIFSIDTGCGYTTVLNLLSQLLAEEGLFNAKSHPVEIVLKAPSPHEDPLEEARRAIGNCKNKIVSLDISNWCDKVASPEFRAFLLKIHRNTNEVIYVFRLPFLEHSVLTGIENALADIMRIQTVVFPPLTNAQLQIISQEKLQAKGFTATEKAWDMFQRRLAEEKSDGRFYSIRTAEKILDDMIFLKVQSILRGTSADENIIDSPDLEHLLSDLSQSASAEELLNSLVGMDVLREKIFEIISQIEFARKTPGVSPPAMHMRFIGNPGTGKTTVARIVGQLLKERGILSKGFFFEHAGGDFIGMYVGHTAPKTLSLCQDAYGSVLFIDEAYTLANANYHNGSGYAKEAIDTLIAQMENHRDDMVVIMAGYPRDMERLMTMNAGLPGRMPYVLEFPNYSRDELAQIFLHMVQKSVFTLEDAAHQAVLEYFATLDERILNAPDFSNARFVRNIFESTWAKTVTRTQVDGSDVHCITKADFDSAVNDTRQSLRTKPVKHIRPGYHLGTV